MTKVNGTKSEEVNNEFGVPQGSIFIIYINNMSHVLKVCKVILYANETLIYAEGETDEQCKEYLLRDINNIGILINYLNENKTTGQASVTKQNMKKIFLWRYPLSRFLAKLTIAYNKFTQYCIGEHYVITVLHSELSIELG